MLVFLGPANHTLAMITAFNMIKKLIYGNDGVSCAHSTNDSSSLDVEPIILYISRGLLMSLTERGSVLNLVARENQCLRGRVIINTYPVIDGKLGFPVYFSLAYKVCLRIRGMYMLLNGYRFTGAIFFPFPLLIILINNC